ncbi:MAG: type II secretion system protein GspH [Gammaproteobacteria bacterium]|nr:MAG: type II secretion system protein GspH [Gammaproteobacteria bacterium]
MIYKSYPYAKQSPVAKINAGFSLLELLVVIVIIGISTLAVTWAFGDNQAERMSHKSRQLAALIELTQEQAMFNSEELGLLFTKDSYTFYKLVTVFDKDNKEKSAWQAIEGDRILTKRSLPDGLEYELYLEGIKVTFAAAKLKEITPHVFILSDGSISPFELNLTDKIDHSYKMKMAENGKYEIEAVN